MKILVGLGNPGVEYANTRHNTGIMLVDKLAEKLVSTYGWRRQYGVTIYKTRDLILVKTAEYFMNESNHVIRDLAKVTPLKPEDFYLIHDDLDIKLGEYKIQKTKGPKVHNGIEAVENILGTKDFWRVRIGIDSRHPDHRIPGEQYVLQNFSREEREMLDTVLETAADAIIMKGNLPRA